jgi:tRNA threonylcarbamoyladenosine biosynthesis protein TsaE
VSDVARFAEAASATREAGAQFARAIVASDESLRSSLLVTLSGDLGAGKTTFVGGLLHALGHVGPARSPTYTLIEPYRFGEREVYHCDLYRLRHPDELEDLGLRELRRPGTVLLVEWPEKAAGGLGAPDVEIELQYVGESARALRFVARPGLGAAVLGHLRSD